MSWKRRGMVMNRIKRTAPNNKSGNTPMVKMMNKGQLRQIAANIRAANKYTQ